MVPLCGAITLSSICRDLLEQSILDPKRLVLSGCRISEGALGE